MRGRRFGQGAIAVAVTALLLAAAPPAFAASLYTGPGPRPGPDILYEPPLKPSEVPQLQNTGVWSASPILVSGASAYRQGEFLYQDFLYDDHGANGGQRDPNDPRSSGDTFSNPNGTYTYPTNTAYAGNAADLVELRVKPLSDATAFRFTLNTMNDPSLAALSVAIGNSDSPHPFPYGANLSAPAQYFLTVHPSGSKLVADLRDAATNAVVPGGTPTVAVDESRRQIEVRVPHGAWNPGTGTWRLAAGAGLWDKSAKQYLIPRFSADADHPGGSGALSNPPAFFNVAFRRDEPFPDYSDAAGTLQNGSKAAWWRDRQQGESLRSGDMTPFHADVDFGKLAAGTTDDGDIPTTGPINRILASHFESKQGTDYSTTCGEASSCVGELRGRLQPYTIYVPHKPKPKSGYPLTLLLHSLSAGYNQYSTSRNQSQLGERGRGSIVITPEGRGPDSWYFDYGGADTFEVWADVASRYQLDPSRTTTSGYSMGGYGTFKFATQFPDLFAKAQTTVGPPALGIWVPPAPPTGGESTNTNHMLPSVRNIPFLMWVQDTDELVPYAGTHQQAQTFDDLGYRYEFDSFTVGDHLTLAINDQYQPAADFLDDAVVNRDPPHVTYVVNPTMDFPANGTVADHAYWLSGLKVRDTSGSSPGGDPPKDKVDVRSEGFGVGDPAPGATQSGAGTLTGGNVGNLPFTSQSKAWGAAPRAPRRDRLDIDATNISQVTIEPGRARVSCNADLNVSTDGPLTVTLAGCGRTETFH